VTQRLERADTAALRLTVIPVAKRIGGPTQLPGGRATDSFGDTDVVAGAFGAAGENLGHGTPEPPADHDVGDEWAMSQSPPPSPPMPPLPPTPRAGYAGVMASTLAGRHTRSLFSQHLHRFPFCRGATPVIPNEDHANMV